MPLKIIGAGFGRTGTNSLRLALNQLGAGPCYHMHEVKNNPGHKTMWYEIAFGKKPDWEKAFEHYQAALDWPATHYWDQLADQYPKSKIILTVRDPDSWFKSFSNTIRRTLHLPEVGEITEENRRHRQTIFKIIEEETFDGQSGNKALAIQRFNQRIERVKSKIHPDRLLIYDISQGWAPLCDFLGLPHPDEPFPHTNTTAEFIAQAPEKYRPFMEAESPGNTNAS